MGKALSEMIDDIINGANKHLYPTWAKHAPLSVRRELAIQGYELDTLINDPDRDIRWFTMNNRPEYILKQLQNGHDEDLITTMVEDDVYVEPEILERLIQFWEAENRPKVRLIRIKLQSQQEEVSSLESTMSRVALYAVDNPLWAKGLSIYQIMCFFGSRRAGYTVEAAIEEALNN